MLEELSFSRLQPVLAQMEAIVGGEDHPGAFQRALGVNLVKQRSDHLVYREQRLGPADATAMQMMRRPNARKSAEVCAQINNGRPKYRFW